jgi:hypothetical protein
MDDKELRWNLAKLYRDRADHSANIIRGALFSAATAIIGFIAYGKTGAELRAHTVPLILLGLGWSMTLFSWDIQKGKAIRKFDALRDGNLDHDQPRLPKAAPTSFVERLLDRIFLWRSIDRVNVWLSNRPNYIIDRWAAWLIGTGAAGEIIIRMYVCG